MAYEELTRNKIKKFILRNQISSRSMCGTDNRIKVAPHVSLSINVEVELRPLTNLTSHGISSVRFVSAMKEIFVKSGRLYVFFFFIFVFALYQLKTSLVFISYFVSILLRKGYRGLEYRCSFEPVSFSIFDHLY